jgi:hypothetical protein
MTLLIKLFAKKTSELLKLRVRHNNWLVLFHDAIEMLQSFETFSKIFDPLVIIGISDIIKLLGWDPKCLISVELFKEFRDDLYHLFPTCFLRLYFVFEFAGFSWLNHHILFRLISLVTVSHRCLWWRSILSTSLSHLLLLLLNIFEFLSLGWVCFCLFF